MSSEEIVGFGVRAPDKINASFEKIWSVMIDKVYHPDKYLPVTDVKTEDRGENHVYRQMKLKDSNIVREDIYLDKDKGEATFVREGEDQIHLNKFHKDNDKQYLEYWAQNQEGQRISWNVPKTVVLQAMKITKDKAEQ